MEKVLFIDRDGVILKEPPEDRQVDSLEKMEFIPGVIAGLKGIIDQCEFSKIVMVSNQDGLGTQSFPEADFRIVQEKMERILAGEGIVFDEVLIDRTFPEEGAETRKPGTGLIEKYINGFFDIAGSVVIGDRITDMQFAVNIGSKAIWFSDKGNVDNFHGIPPETVLLVSGKWDEIRNFLTTLPRRIILNRKTNETDIKISLSPDGQGKGEISTGLRFFDHMLEQLAFHSGCDISITAEGDIGVDEHHTIEDTALLLGEAFRRVLGSKKGIERFGFVLPMDDSLAEVALDTGGRSWLEWECEFSRETLGDVPNEMFKHFFRSLSQSAGWALHIRVKGENDHHKIESVFKSLGRSIREAVKRGNLQKGIPSTKGKLR